MIIRHSLLRQGRKALLTQPPRSWSRFLATATDSVAETVETQMQRSLQEIHAIESQINSRSSDPVQPIDDATHETVAPSDEFAQNYWDFQRSKQVTARIGADLEPFYKPHTLISNPPSPANVTLELLMASQTHMGHKTSHWNPANSRYIFGIREDIHIISLDVTAAHLRRAAKIVKGVVERGGLVLFVGTRPGQDRAVVRAAQLAGGCHLFERWIPGSITNGQQILGRCKVKVVDEFDRTVPGFEEQLIDRAALKPDLVVCLNPLENYVLLHECGINNIPTIGIIDTDANPTWVTYPIPANDDSIRSINLIAGVLGRAGEEGIKNRQAIARAEGRPLFARPEGLTEIDFKVFEALKPASEEEVHPKDAVNLAEQ